MARPPRTVDQAIARFDEYSARLDGHTPAMSAARRRQLTRSAASLGRRLATIGIALTVLAVATVVLGLMMNGIGWTGLFVVSVLTIAILFVFSIWPGEPAEKKYDEATPTRDVIRSFDSFLLRRRPALPAPAARKVDAISQQLPLLEQRLTEVDPLDPLAQDARRLMGRHLPELIERYERVPPPYRRERDGEGLSVDERLVSSLDAAHEALNDIGAQLAKQDRDAFETKGRFIESRYKDPDALGKE